VTFKAQGFKSRVAMALFVPINFNKLAKDANDLLKPPKYNFSAKTVNRTSEGWRFETSGASSKGKLTGAVKLNASNQHAHFEGHLNTDNSVAEIKASGFKFYQDVTGSVLLNGGSDNPNTFEAEVVYSPPDFVVASLKAAYRADSNVEVVTGNVAIGAQGLSVAAMGEVVIDTQKAEPYRLRDYNTGLQYNGGDFVASLSSKVGKEKDGGYAGGRMEDMEVSFIHNVSKDQKVAARFEFNNADERVLTWGFDRRLSPHSHIKAIVSTKGAIHTRFTRTFPDRRLKLGFAHEFSAKGYGFNVQNFGVSAEFGEV